MNSKIISTKTTSAIFLAIVLVTGTITALSSLIVGAQAQPYYNSYEPPQYQPSYKPDYKAKYPSDNNNYKSKDSSKSVSINKLKCINNNLNLNGNNTGDVNIGNKGQGYSGAYSSGVNGEGYNGYYDGYEKKGKGFDDCVINNNNTNTNTNINVGVGGGNQTTPPEDLACEECFAVNSTLQTEITDALVEFNGTLFISTLGSVLIIGPGTDTIEQLCDIIGTSTELFGPVSNLVLDRTLSFILAGQFGIEVPAVDAIIECLIEAGIIVERELPPPPPDSISANGIAGANVQCTGDPLCARLQ